MSRSALPTPVPSPEIAGTMRHGLGIISAYPHLAYRSVDVEPGLATIESTSVEALNELFTSGTVQYPANMGIVDDEHVARYEYRGIDQHETALLYGRDSEGGRKLTELERESAFAIVEFIGSLATSVHGASIVFHQNMAPSLTLDIPYPEVREHRTALIDTLYKPTIVREGQDTATFSNRRLLPMNNYVGGGNLNIAVREPKDPQRLVRIPRRRFGRRQFDS